MIHSEGYKRQRHLITVNESDNGERIQPNQHNVNQTDKTKQYFHKNALQTICQNATQKAHDVALTLIQRCLDVNVVTC